jgi:hypothetical protein
MFVVPTISFRLLYGLLIMGHGRRHILWFGVTAHPTAEWIANQVTEACGWEQAPRYLIRDRDGAYGEVEGALADWIEVDGEKHLWTIPGVRMKGDRPDRPHLVPLTPAATKVLKLAGEQYGSSGLIFPGMMRGKPISDVSLAKAIARHTDVEATTHGFRSTFRDWAGDMTNFPREVCEQALAHVIEDETEAAYRRSDGLAKRRRLMQEWAAFCMSEV